MAFSSSNKNSASARDSSVLPTPVGPRKMKEPIGRFSSCKPARARLTAFETATIASCCPMTRWMSRSSSLTSFSRSPSCKRETGMWVQLETTSAMSSSVTSSRSKRGFLSVASFSAISRNRFSSSGMRPYWISLALPSSPRRCARSSSVRAVSSSSFTFAARRSRLSLFATRLSFRRIFLSSWPDLSRASSGAPCSPDLFLFSTPAAPSRAA